MRGRLLLILAWGLCAGGCVERTLTMRSNPPEALLFVNGTEVGRTPFKHDFVWYGTYDVELRKQGYQTLKARGPVIAPWWQWVPFDLLAELAPFTLHDRQQLTYTMRPLAPVTTDPQALLNRAQSMRPLLESSIYTRTPTTLPMRPTSRTTRPTTHPTRTAATRAGTM